MKFMSAAPLIFLALNSYAKDFTFCTNSLNKNYGVSDVKMDKGKPRRILENSVDGEVIYEFSRDGEILSKKTGESTTKFNWTSGRLDSYALYEWKIEKTKNKTELKQSWIAKFDYGSDGYPYKKSVFRNESKPIRVEYSYRKNIQGLGHKEFCIDNNKISDYAYWSLSGEMIEYGDIKGDPSSMDEESLYYFLSSADYNKWYNLKGEYENGRLTSTTLIKDDGGISEKKWYGSEGFPTSENTLMGDGRVRRRLFKYEVDDKGNWIKMSTYDLVFSGFGGGDKYKPVLSEEKTRSISYFD